ncbi:MAG: glycoside hydrolase family 127 protein [Phycisphaerae bacterium]|nr:glycoside hydrolase family 127 protein [Phycisphaerae bacterium]
MKRLEPSSLCVLSLVSACLAAPVERKAGKTMGEFACDEIRGARFTFTGPMGQRISANLDNWLLIAPRANPGMLEMFRVRDRKPVPKLVPWAGEFAGKYLISAVQTRRMLDDPRLDAHLRSFIAELIATQAEDGYLGPFRKQERLLGHWDLWGHYHCMLALMMWYEDTGDEAAKQCALRAADLICKTYLETDRRPIQAGSSEMNLAPIHVLGRIYRHTGDQKYLAMMRVFEKDFEQPQAGDYFRQGLAGVDFYQTPKPRWESLHPIQGLAELFLITGNADYRTALTNLWASMARYDRHNTGGFTTGEQAIGNPYEPGAIETCCTTAWVALTIDALRLTADPKAADELELATWNSVIGSQHPSGRWWTYNTPMDGRREASAHTIVFQARAGTPELNCCSVNAPRGIGMLSEWALMADAAGLFVNYYGPMQARLDLPDGTKLKLDQTTSYPSDGHVVITLEPDKPVDLNVRLRIPAWSKSTSVRVSGQKVERVEPGAYLCLKRTWKAGDRIEIDLDMSIRTWVGDGPCSGKVSLYYGPLLLAYDQHFNPFDADEIPTIDLKQLAYTKQTAKERFEPIVLLRFKGVDGREVNLCDFATAGACGTEYRSWLPVTNAPPPPLHLRRPANAARIPAGPNRFEWSGARRVKDRTYSLLVATDRSMKDSVVTANDLDRPWHVVREGINPGKTYYWQVTAHNPHGAMQAESGPWTFTVDPSLENEFIDHPALFEFRQDGVVTASPLDGDGKPTYGYLADGRGTKPAPDRQSNAARAVEFSGNAMLRYRIPYFPEDDYTVAAWVCPLAEPDKDHIAQVFSAWCRPMDDPLRITHVGGKLHARIEAGQAWGTEGAPVKLGQWVHVAAVKHGTTLSLWIDGKLVAKTNVPKHITSSAKDFALGGNPHYTGHEYFRGRIDEFVFLAKALEPDDIARLVMGSS